MAENEAQLEFIKLFSDAEGGVRVGVVKNMD